MSTQERTAYISNLWRVLPEIERKIYKELNIQTMFEKYYLEFKNKFEEGGYENLELLDENFLKNEVTIRMKEEIAQMKSDIQDLII
jgi:hypothetical protein